MGAGEDARTTADEPPQRRGPVVGDPGEDAGDTRERAGLGPGPQGRISADVTVGGLKATAPSALILRGARGLRGENRGGWGDLRWGFESETRLKKQPEAGHNAR